MKINVLDVINIKGYSLREISAIAESAEESSFSKKQSHAGAHAEAIPTGTFGPLALLDDTVLFVDNSKFKHSTCTPKDFEIFLSYYFNHYATGDFAAVVADYSSCGASKRLQVEFSFLEGELSTPLYVEKFSNGARNYIKPATGCVLVFDFDEDMKQAVLQTAFLHADDLVEHKYVITFGTKVEKAERKYFKGIVDGIKFNRNREDGTYTKLESTCSVQLPSKREKVLALEVELRCSQSSYELPDACVVASGLQIEELKCAVVAKLEGCALKINKKTKGKASIIAKAELAAAGVWSPLLLFTIKKDTGNKGSHKAKITKGKKHSALPPYFLT
ncbi:MAG: hypothetical protein HON32_00130 [Francisellaceae bacterium]|jgi:hypothetical protein|nr:hypothetical protein [Francisellaceae bacterium]MBT6537987.1 hypothetical protein [Francisellaceae bacterium]